MGCAPCRVDIDIANSVRDTIYLPTRCGSIHAMLCGSQSELQARQNASEAALHCEHICLGPVRREEGRPQTALHVDPHWEQLSPSRTRRGRHC